MAVSEELLRLMLRHYPGWMSSPEAFLEFITLIDFGMKQDRYKVLDDEAWTGDPLSEQSLKLAEVILMMIPVNIHPYHTFEQIVKSCLYEKDYKKEFMVILNAAQQHDEILFLLRSQGVHPSQETMMREIAIETINDQIIEALRAHIRIV